jgi:signal transduction histidine kinase
LELGNEVSYNFRETLERVLVTVASNITCQAAFIAIRQGEIFRIEGGWKCAPSLVGDQISIDDNMLLEELARVGEPKIVTNIRLTGNLTPAGGFERAVRSWLGVPLVLGKRVIGLMVFVSFRRGSFKNEHLRKAATLAQQVSPYVENAIAFAEARRHLQRLALLNELAAAASAGLDIEKVAARVLRMLRRTFHTEFIALLLLSSDGETLREYGEEEVGATSLVIPMEESLAGEVVRTGMPMRLDNVHRVSGIHAADPSVRSEMAVPLKYRGKVIGVLDLASQEANAFSDEDEQLLVVISSHLAGLIENVRLSEETRERARNIGLIHQVVQRVVGLTDLERIAQLSAELMADRFDYELATVLMTENRDSRMVHRGVGGKKAHHIKVGTPLQLDGYIARIIQNGESYLANDIGEDPEDSMVSGWRSGSLMCVPLKEGDWVFGVINVEREKRYAFLENDLLILESLAGFLSSVMMNARRYQQLQTNVRHMQAARETALDISADLGLDTLLRRVVHRVRELVEVKGVELGLVDQAEQVVRVLVSENPWQEDRGDTIPLMAGVAGRVAAFGEPVVVNDYKSWKGKLKARKKASITSAAGVPLIYKGEVIGTLTVFDDLPARVFQAEDVELLELLAPQVAVSIRNARLYQELQERIEAHKLAENRLIQSARLAAVGEMAAGVAHELNNPLTTVTGFAELILDELSEDFPQRPDVELILKESRRARGVVRRLLDFSRQTESMKERADINEVVEDVVAMVRHLARTGGVETQLDLNRVLPLVYIDRNHLKQVLLNLVHNALHAMPTGGDLILNTYQKSRDGEDWVILEVQDTGQGIPPDHLGRIFEPFFTTKPTGTGTGLGLSISYGIISDHGGYIEVESEVGQGSCFKIWLPVDRENVDA